MQILQEMNSRIHEIIGTQEFNAELNYIPTQYVYREKVDDGLLYYNSLTKAIVLIKDDESFPLKEMVENWFFFEDGVDQYKFLMDVKAAYKKKQNSKLNHIVIFTTMGCNARCPYCYEKDYDNKIPMTEKVALDTAKWICKTVKQPYTVQWFGGEPLTNPRAIEIISQYLNDNSPYEWHSSIITNGYLIDNVGVDKLINEYRVQDCQITLDGIFNDYNEIKNFIYNDANPFSKVVNNIKLLLDRHITVDIRLNVTIDNYKQLSSVVSYMKEKFGDTDLLHVYSSPTYPEKDKDFSIEDRNKMYENYSNLQSLIRKTFNNNVTYHMWDSFAVTNCMADRETGLCVTPIGNISLCEHHVNDELIGNIYMDKYDAQMIDSWKTETPDLIKCHSCSYKPMCFYLEKCAGSLKCTSVLEKYRNDTVHYGLKQWYKNYLIDKSLGNANSPCYADVVLPEVAVFTEDEN